jgi:GTP-binding protein HflX
MADIIENKEEPERVILVAVSLDEKPGSNDLSTNASLDELEELAATAGAVTVGRLIQNRESVHNGTYIGKGKIEELRIMVEELDADAIITDDELSPAQMRNLEDILGIKICDRTMIILDIFAKHAVTREGKIQVELAQLRYSLQRLTGKGIAMSRLGGGIGTRGPGEKKLEQDRRLIRDRISRLKAELTEIVKNRELLRKQRERNQIPVVAIVGYTNAGKSTLLNKLTDSDILAADMLFATLDATTRNLKLPSGQEVLFTDTVGFINKLPHHLVEAFRSTLEEATYADVILHVVDASNPDAFTQMAVVYETLGRLGADGKPIVTAFNKQDKTIYDDINGGIKDLKADVTVKISAKTGEGLDELKGIIEKILNDRKVYMERIIPYSDGGYLNSIRRFGTIVSEEYAEDGVHVTAYVPTRLI